MEYPNKSKIGLLLILLAFFFQGYSTPLDTIEKPNCPNGFLIQVNNELCCIDTAIIYYPTMIPYPNSIFWLQWDVNREHFSYNKTKSINLQILGEPIWYNKNMQEDLLRIFLIEYAPNYDSIVFYSFVKQDQKFMKLVKKEMPIFYYPICFMHDSSYFVYNSAYFLPNMDYVFPDSSCYYYIKNIHDEIQSVNYKQTEFMIHKKEMKKMFKQLDNLKNCDIFHRYGANFPSFVIEYFMQGEYYLLVAEEPKEWGALRPEFAYVEKNCRKKDGLKILKWLKQY